MQYCKQKRLCTNWLSKIKHAQTFPSAKQSQLCNDLLRIALHNPAKKLTFERALSTKTIYKNQITISLNKKTLNEKSVKRSQTNKSAEKNFKHMRTILTTGSTQKHII